MRVTNVWKLAEAVFLDEWRYKVYYDRDSWIDLLDERFGGRLEWI